MRVLFCKISGMKYYKGVCDKDIPCNGGSFVEENGYGHEEFNFLPIQLDGNDELECLGFFEPKSHSGKRNMIHIENIEGCNHCTNVPSVDDILVIWCATRLQGDTTVVGWYKGAEVFRELQDWTVIFEDGHEQPREYNVRAKASNCTLLPVGERNRYIWYVPSAKNTRSYGFGRAMLWYPTEPEAQDYLKRMIDNINNYHGENWLEKFPSENDW